MQTLITITSDKDEHDSTTVAIHSLAQIRLSENEIYIALTNNNENGELTCVTFSDEDQALSAYEKACVEWKKALQIDSNEAKT